MRGKQTENKEALMGSKEAKEKQKEHDCQRGEKIYNVNGSMKRGCQKGSEIKGKKKKERKQGKQGSYEEQKRKQE